MEHNERENRMDELRSEAASTAAHASERVAATAHKTAARIGDQMKCFAGRIRESGPRMESAIQNSAERLAQKLERGGSYFTDGHYQDTTRKITQYVRQHPVTAMMIGIAAGLLLASKRRH
jgi:ElaB/YqjD/DUF883 family membrane-anchored ribosome-binding protein